MNFDVREFAEQCVWFVVCALEFLVEMGIEETC